MNITDKALPLLVQTASVAIGMTALLAFTVFLFTGPWKVVVMYDDIGTVLLFDLCLSLAFFIQHSGMIRRSFKNWFARHAPVPYHGAMFSIVSGICLLSVIHFWQASNEIIVIAENPLRMVLRGVFWAALIGITWSTLLLQSIDAFGVQAIKSHRHTTTPPPEECMERGPYRWVRHPQYFCVLAMIWSQPDLTADRLLFNMVWSTWIVIGTLLEERDLAETFGHQYLEYQSRVPMLIPWRIPH